MGRKRRHTPTAGAGRPALQQFMDRNNEGLLTDQERAGLAAMAELSEAFRW